MGWDPCELFPLYYSGVPDAEAFPTPLAIQLLQEAVPPYRNEDKEKKLPLPRSKQVSWEH